MAMRGPLIGWRSERGGDLDLDRRAARQRGHADGVARVAAGVAEDLVQDAARAVGHGRLLDEVVDARDEHRHREDALDRVEGAEVSPEEGHRVERGQARALGAASRGQVAAEDALGVRGCPRRCGAGSPTYGRCRRGRPPRRAGSWGGNGPGSWMPSSREPGLM